MACQSLFTEIEQVVNSEYSRREDVRLIVQELDRTIRNGLCNLQMVHQVSEHKIPESELCAKIRNSLSKCVPYIKQLKTKIPAGEYYKFHEQFKFSIQHAVILMCFVDYLTGTGDDLTSYEHAAAQLGMSAQAKVGSFHLDLEDYLHALISLASELSRLAVNSAARGDYDRPVRIAQFLKDLDAGFRMLNMKNDPLRKRFDGLKYDLKKVEEVVYDIRIRSLKTTEEGMKE